MARRNSVLASLTAAVTSLTVILLVVHLFFHDKGNAHALGQSNEPIALIKSILIGGTPKLEVSILELRVKRVSGATEAGKADLRLYQGDEVETGGTTQVTLLFLDNPAEKDNEVLVDVNTRVRVGSIFNWVGRVLVTVKGAFDAGTRKVRLGVQGTQYELTVSPDGTNRVVVLEGQVSVTKEETAYWQTEDDFDLNEKGLKFRNTSYSTSSVQQEQLQLVIAPGQSNSFENTFSFTNRCSKRHVYEIRSPRNLNWFQILGADQFEVGPGQSKAITFAMRLNAPATPGVYEGEILASCLDCAQEVGCDIAGLLLPVRVTVLGNVPTPGPTLPATPSPRVTPAPTPSQTNVTVRRLEEVVLTGDVLESPRIASQTKVLEAVAWSNIVIVAAQPSYSAQSIVPHFQNWAVRDQTFREARLRAIVDNDAASYKTIGDIYSDWGNGAKAVDSYNRMNVSFNELSAQELADLGEAYRLAGRLKEAESALTQAVNKDPNSAVARNALGNLRLDQAKLARERNDGDAARAFAEQARVQYENALRLASSSRHHGSPRGLQLPTAPSTTIVRAISQANIGEALRQQAELERDRNRGQEALQVYAQAEAAFKNAFTIDQRYTFAVTGLGAVYRGAGETLENHGERARADQFFSRAEDRYRQAISLHTDMAEAYVGLGGVLETTNRKDEAIAAYFRASQVRPEQPESHYLLAMSFYESDPRLAADYARTYLRLERPPFRTGAKANNATRVSTGERPAVTPTPTPYPTATTTPSPSPQISPTLIKIPGLRGDRADKALAELQQKGLKGELRDRYDCDGSGKVVDTSPKDAKVPAGTLITVFVSAVEPNAPTVPALVHQSRTDAEQALRQVGLALRVRGTTETDDHEANTVLEQRPRSGMPLTSRCQVSVVLAVPVPKVRVPSYINNSREYAFSRLPRYFGDLVRGSVTEIDSDQPAGTVVDQNPKPGTLVKKGSSVDLYISRAVVVDRQPEPPPGVTVPNFFGKTEKEARTIIGNMNGALQVGQVTYRNDYEHTSGTVIEQSHPAFSKVPPGTAINLVIAVYPIR